MDSNPLFWPSAIALAAGLAGVVIARIFPSFPRLRAALAAFVFVAAESAVYAKFFPWPRAATDKLFYAGLFGVLSPFLPGTSAPAGALWALLPMLWVAAPHLGSRGALPDLALIGGGCLLLFRFAACAASLRPGSGALAWAVALALLGGSAPIALAGGSASSLLLLLALVVGYTPWALAEFLVPLPPHPGLAAIWSGPLTLAAILFFITGAEDGIFLIVLFLLVLAVGEGALHLLARSDAPRRVVLASGVLFFLLVLGVVGVLYLSMPEAFAT
jgi:hypothetical protein